ncbi:MAG TPA: aminopeptidase P family protein [Chloroflexota bacterium]|nr:aminopeptidase P family protein [Chloroflexota bacterium]
MSTRDRLAALRRGLQRTEPRVDAVLVSEDQNRRYVSGFTGSAGQLLVTADAALLLTDFRYVEQSAWQAPDFEVVKTEGFPWPAVAEQAKRLGVRRLGFESEHLTVDQHTRLTAALRETAPDVALAPLTGCVEESRQVKDAEEIERLRTAVLIADRAMEAVTRRLRPGMTEKAIAWELEVEMRQHGAEALSFPIIVASGPNGAMPHHRPSDRAVREGETITIDMGCKVGGYCSDLTRTVVLGEPDATFWGVYDTVLRAQQTCEGRLRAGMTGKAGDALARDVIAAAGHGEHFGHGTGHGVGLAIHEQPRLTYTAAGEATVPEGAVVTVEPGIYVPGWGGVRIEDMVVVGKDRCHVLTTAHKAPIIKMGEDS